MPALDQSAHNPAQMETPPLAERILIVDDFWGKEAIFFKGIVSGILTIHVPFIPHEYWGGINWTQCAVVIIIWHKVRGGEEMEGRSWRSFDNEWRE